MLEQLSTLTVEELKTGFTASKDGFQCLICGKEFRCGEVYPMEEHFYLAEQAIRVHCAAHGSMLEQLLNGDSKYLTVTDVQKKLLSMMGQGLPDKEIAAQLGIAASTVRHQRFAFREKAKQAKLYLALYELALAGSRKEEQISEFHNDARQVDDRYLVTDAEREKIRQLAFESRSPLKLRRFPPKEKKKLVILGDIAEQFQPGRQYTEKEVNAILGAIYNDYVTLRRSLIEYGFMERTTDCRAYWRTAE